jgi:hypothetical protein
VKAPAELISSTCPFRFAISGSAACAVSMVPIRLTSIVRASACADDVITVVSGAMPALATTTSSPPKVSTVRWTAAFSASGSVTSASTHRCSGPSWSATRASSSGSRPTSATRAPRAAALRASAAPIPRAAPVISTDFPVRDVREVRKAMVGSSDPGARIEHKLRGRCSLLSVAQQAGSHDARRGADR